MKEPLLSFVHVTCANGHERAIAFSQMREPITCIECGAVDHIEPEQIPHIEAAFGRAMMEAAAQRDAGAVIGIGSADVPRRRP